MQAVKNKTSVGRHGQSWREANAPEHQRSFTGFIVGAVLGAAAWIAFINLLLAM